MLNENAKKWIEALRSGKYEQGIGYLNFNDKFCCLGVACEIFKEELNLKVEIQTSIGYNGKTTKICFYNGREDILPDDVKNHLELCYPSGNFSIPKELLLKAQGEVKLFETDTSLTVLNDSGKYTFEQIADIIENEPERRFRK